MCLESRRASERARGIFAAGRGRGAQGLVEKIGGGEYVNAGETAGGIETKTLQTQGIMVSIPQIYGGLAVNN